MMRKLVSIRQVKDILPIEKADAIECLVVDGWKVVSQKGNFQIGDKCVFHEIDSFLPADEPRYEFLRKSGVKTDPSGKERIRLRTIKLRGQLSQGLALPLKEFPEFQDYEIGTEVTEELGVIKYERPEPKTTNAAGHRPDFIPKTDEERIQNVYGEYVSKYKDTEYYPTMKLDGSSCTVAFLNDDMQEFWKNDPLYSFTHGPVKTGEFIVCSRNLELKYDQDSHFYKAVIRDKILLAAEQIGLELGKSVAIQGEVLGPGIQGNKEKLNEFRFYAFNIFNITDQEYVSYDECQFLFKKFGVQSVPLISQPIRVFSVFDTMEDILKYAEGPSIVAKEREGIVFKSKDGNAPSFKAISNRFLLKGGDE